MATRHMPSPNASQKEFIVSIKDYATNLQPSPVSYEPPLYYLGGTPNVSHFYRKPIILCAPHLSFPDIKIPCDHNECEGHFVSNGWGDNDRYLHGLNGGVYLVQGRYVCSKGVAKCPGKRTGVVGTVLITLPTCPVFITAAYDKFSLTHRRGVTTDLLNHIVHDSISSKSFVEIQRGREDMHANRYLKLRGSYDAAVDFYCHQNPGVLPTAFAEFSAMDDPLGYNEIRTPNVHYLIDIFEG